MKLHIKKRKYLFFIIIATLLTSCATPSYVTPQTSIPDLFTQTHLMPLKPFVPPEEFMRKTITHEVAPMESLWRISKMYDVSQISIVRANNIKTPQSLTTGQKLIIPDAAPLKTYIPLYPNTMWKYIIVHHTASDIGSARLVDTWHQNRGFWNGLGYHFLIDNGSVGKQDGQIEISPRWIKQQKGAHCKAGNMNENSIGIALVGNFSKNLPSQKQMDSLVFLINQLSDYYSIPASHVIGHRDAPGASTECPGLKFPWKKLKAQIR